MRGLYLASLLVVLALLLPSPGQAVQPDEILADPALEQRAREISKELRCLVCQNESIDDSNAELARDLRLLVRERLVAGDTDVQVRQYLVDRYGEFVLLKPTFTLANAVFWFAGPALFILGLIAVLAFLRSRRRDMPEALSDQEKAALERLLKD